MQDRGAYFNNNHGRPNNTAMERPMSGNPHGNPGGFNNNSSGPGRGEYGGHDRGVQNEQPQDRGPQSQHPNNGFHQGGQPQIHEPHNNPQPQSRGLGNNPQPQSREPHGNAQPQSHEPHNNPQPHGDRGGQDDRGHDHGHER